MTWRVLDGDCRDAMKEMPDASVDAVVCDPPYGLEFMGKDWDTLGDRRQPGDENFTDVDNPYGRGKVRYGYAKDAAATGRAMQEWHESWAREALRVLKPGGHMLAFGGTRTYHRLAAAVEDAGFEIRDCIAWMYGSGFPKSLDVSKAIDKAARGVPQGAADPTSANHGRYRTQATEGKRGDGDAGRGYGAGPGQFMAEEGVSEDRELVESAQPWEGWGTALKPAFEPIVVARKPLVATVAGNVLAHGTGGLNIDGCRIGGESTERERIADDFGLINDDGWTPTAGTNGSPEGRWPANVVLDEQAGALLDEQAPDTGGGGFPGEKGGIGQGGVYGAPGSGVGLRDTGRVDENGGASRFFYCAKTSTAERNAGLDAFEKKAVLWSNGEANPGSFQSEGTEREARNPHPTVKPIDLMRWLVRLVTPPAGVVLDPFAGSGSTGCACVLEEFDFIGVELSAEYADIARARIGWWAKRPHAETAAVLVAGKKDAEREAVGQMGLL